MFYDTIDNLMTELPEIMDRIESSVKDKTITSEQRIDAIVARDYIYNGFLKLKSCEKEKK